MPQVFVSAVTQAAATGAIVVTRKITHSAAKSPHFAAPGREAGARPPLSPRTTAYLLPFRILR